MGYEAKIILDSINTSRDRLTTFEITFPRMVLAELNTHRMLARNSASSRAIPVEKMLKRVESDPFVPFYWGRNQKGMQATAELGPDEAAAAEKAWMESRDAAITGAKALLDLEVHKQIANRILEPFMWHTVIVTATDYSNFFKLRCHLAAAPEIRKIADMMKVLYQTNLPQLLDDGEVHLPYIHEDEFHRWDLDELKRISSGRCARVSYLTHDGIRDPQKDIELCTSLTGNGHWSPLEHVAIAKSGSGYCGNFRGWVQYRKEFPDESGNQ